MSLEPERRVRTYAAIAPLRGKFGPVLNRPFSADTWDGFGAACAPICALMGKLAEKPRENRQKRDGTRNDECVPGIGLDAGTTAPIQAWFNVSIFGGGRSRAAGVELATASEPPVRSLSSRRTSAGICRNLNRILCFHDARGVSAIGFVRRIFADCAHPTHLIPVLLYAVWIDQFRPLETINPTMDLEHNVKNPILRSLLIPVHV